MYYIGRTVNEDVFRDICVVSANELAEKNAYLLKDQNLQSLKTRKEAAIRCIITYNYPYTDHVILKSL